MFEPAPPAFHIHNDLSHLPSRLLLHEAQAMLRDPVCGKRIHRNHAHAHIEYERVTYYLCCPRCQAEFEAGPGQFARPEFGETSSVPASRVPVQQRSRR